MLCWSKSQKNYYVGGVAGDQVGHDPKARLERIIPNALLIKKN